MNKDSQMSVSSPSPKRGVSLAVMEKVKKRITEDYLAIDQMIAQGALRAEQGTSLKQTVMEKVLSKLKAMEGSAQAPNVASNQETKEGLATNQAPQVVSSILQAFSEMEKTRPNFFGTDARKLVKSYLEKGSSDLDTGELNKIASLIEMLEQGAIAGHEQSKTQEKAFCDEIERVKSGLTSSVLGSSRASSFPSKAFTRGEIAKMSPDEFLACEKDISEQIKQGLI